MTLEALKYWLWLTNLPGIGNMKIRALLKQYKTPIQIWQATQKELSQIVFLTKGDMQHLMHKSLSKADAIMQDMCQNNIQAITIQDKHYPSLLKHIYGAPCILYVRGQVEVLRTEMIAVVGSRRASVYGKKVAEKLAYEMAERDITIVSGMARGIDTHVHKGALKAGKKTIAVLGCGVDIVYPKENDQLMGYIIKSGAVISEFPPGTSPTPNNFPARNRIISGLSAGTVVVEAGERSGSLITADFALEQGREVFAVPGNIDSPGSEGTNNLIKQGAKLITCTQDILEELPFLKPAHKNKQHKSVRHDINYGRNNQSDYRMSQEEKQVMPHITSAPIHIDTLCRLTALPVHKLNAILTLLEIQGAITQLPGKRFVLN